MKAQAFRPNFLNMPSMVKDSPPKAEASDEERAIAFMSEGTGWKILAEFITGLLKDMDNLNVSSISSGASFEEIGKNTVVVNMAKEVINRILTKVSDSKGAVEKLNE